MPKGRRKKVAKAPINSDAEPQDLDFTIANVNNSHGNPHTRGGRVIESEDSQQSDISETIRTAKLKVQVKSKVVIPDATPNPKLKGDERKIQKAEVDTFTFQEGDDEVNMEFEVNSKAESEFASENEAVASDSESENESDGGLVSEAESGQIEDQQYFDGNQSGTDDVVGPSGLQNPIKRKSKRSSVEQKIDSLSSSLNALREMMMKQQEKEKTPKKRSAGNFGGQAFDHDSVEKHKDGKESNLLSTSDTTIYHNILNRVNEKEKDNSDKIQVDEDIVFKKNKQVAQNRNSSSSEEPMDTSDEIMDMDVDLNIVSECFIADCEQEAIRRQSGASQEMEASPEVEARRLAEEKIKEAEASKARILSTPGKQSHSLNKGFEVPVLKGHACCCECSRSGLLC